VILFEFRHDLRHQKARVMGLSCGIICVILRLAVLIQYRSATDRQTDRHTHTHTTMAYTALSIVSRGKNLENLKIDMADGRHFLKLKNCYISATILPILTKFSMKLPTFVTLAFRNGMGYRYLNLCVNSAHGACISCENFLKCDPVTELICERLVQHGQKLVYFV